ncbi:MAG: flagellin [Chloroflexota bacterium]
MTINTNIMALNAQHRLAITSLEQAKTLEKLSSGLRINRAADDAAGLAVSEKLRSQIRGTNQAMRNAQDGISMIQTAEGALEEVHSMLQRMRELAVQAANDTYSNEDRKAIDNELQALKTEINAISTRTKFNGKSLLTGALSTQLDSTSQVRSGFVVNATSNTSVTAVDVSGAKAGKTYTFTSTATGLQLSDGTVTQEIADAQLAVAANGSLVLDYNQLGVKITISSVAGETAANVKAGLATRTVVTATGSSSANFQIGAGAGGVPTGDAIQVAFAKVDTSATGLNLDSALSQFSTAVNGGTFTSADAQQLINALDSAITTVNDRRGTLGAAQNRLEHTVNSLSVAVENLSASESRIRDTDVAQETSNMVRAQILTQAGTAVLAQANQVPQSALALLRG